MASVSPLGASIGIPHHLDSLGYPEIFDNSDLDLYGIGDVSDIFGLDRLALLELARRLDGKLPDIFKECVAASDLGTDAPEGDDVDRG